MEEENKDIEVVVDENGENLEISPVYEHLNVAKPNPKEDKKNRQWHIKHLCLQI